MTLLNIEMEENVLPDYESMEDCLLFGEDPIIETKDSTINGIWSDSPEEISKWLEKSSRKFFI